jgi:hypothetical protein
MRVEFIYGQRYVSAEKLRSSPEKTTELETYSDSAVGCGSLSRLFRYTTPRTADRQEIETTPCPTQLRLQEVPTRLVTPEFAFESIAISVRRQTLTHLF